MRGSQKWSWKLKTSSTGNEKTRKHCKICLCIVFKSGYISNYSLPFLIFPIFEIPRTCFSFVQLVSSSFLDMLEGVYRSSCTIGQSRLARNFHLSNKFTAQWMVKSRRTFKIVVCSTVIVSLVCIFTLKHLNTCSSLTPRSSV